MYDIYPRQQKSKSILLPSIGNLRFACSKRKPFWGMVDDASDSPSCKDRYGSFGCT